MKITNNITCDFSYGNICKECIHAEPVVNELLIDSFDFKEEHVYTIKCKNERSCGYLINKFAFTDLEKGEIQ